jgi:uncharacterized membrane protein
VLFALVLFLVAVSQRFRILGVHIAAIAVALVLLGYALYEVAEDAQCSVVDCVIAGLERGFDQDPALAIRVLVDIGLRALSPAVNDPTSAAQALDAIQACLERLAARDLDVASVTGV